MLFRELLLGGFLKYILEIICQARQTFVDSLILHVNMTIGPEGDFSNARRKYVAINKSLLSLHCHQLHPLNHSFFFHLFH